MEKNDLQFKQFSFHKKISKKNNDTSKFRRLPTLIEKKGK